MVEAVTFWWLMPILRLKGSVIGKISQSLARAQRSEERNMKYQHIMAAFADSLWAIRPEKLAAIREFLLFKSAGGASSADLIRAIKRDACEPMLCEISESDVLSWSSEEHTSELQSPLNLV